MNTRSVHNVWRSATCMALLLIASSALGTIQTSVNRNRIDLSDTITLTVQTNQKTGSDSPDFSKLEQDWHMLGTRQISNVVWSNGQLQANNSWQITLAPKRKGTLIIPVITWQGSNSKPIYVQVSPITESLKRQIERLAFFKTKISDGPVWVQSQILYQILFYYTQSIQLSRDLSPPNLPNVVVQSLGAPTSGIEQINGIRYWFIKREYALFPQTNGQLEIPVESVSGYARLSQGGRKRIEIHSEGYSIPVMPKPAEYPQDALWLPAQDLRITSNWHKAINTLDAGVATNLNLTIRAQGLPASVLPQFPTLDLPDVRLYSHPPKSDEQFNSKGVTGSLAGDLAIIPTRPGTLVLPEIRIPWWDVKTAKVREAVWPGLSIPVKGTVEASEATANQAGDNTPSQPVESSEQKTVSAIGIWGWLISALLATVWLVTLAYIWLSKRSAGPDQNKTKKLSRKKQEIQNFQKLAEVCENNDAAAIRQNLIRWAECKNLTLEDLLRDDQHGQALIDSLNEYLYKDSSAHFSAKSILAWVEEKRATYLQPVRSQIELSPLYPDTKPS